MAGSDGLAIFLSASTRGLEQGFKRASKSLNGFGKQLGSMSGASKLFGAAVAAIGAVLTVNFAKHVLSTVDALVKMGDNLGLTSEQALGLDHAAKLSGGSMEKLGAALVKMSRALSDARQGMPELEKAFGALGLNVEHLQGLSAHDAFLEITDALNKMENQTERTAILLQLFGRGALSIGSLILAGSEGIKAMEAEAASLNATLSRSDAKKLEEVNDAITRTQTAVQGAAQTFLVEFGPTVAAVLNVLAKGIAGLTDGMREFNAQTQGGAGIVGYLADGIQSLVAGVKGLLGLALDGIAAVVEALDAVPFVLNDSTEAVQTMRLAAEELKQPWKEFWTDGITWSDQFADALKEVTDRAADVQEIVTGNTESLLEQAEAAQESFRKLQADAERVKQAVRTPEEIAADELDNLRKLFDAGLIDEETLRRATEDVGEKLKQALERATTEAGAKDAPTTAEAGLPPAIVQRLTKGTPGQLKMEGATERAALAAEKQVKGQQRMINLLENIDAGLDGNGLALLEF